jgi:hypothetical protein
VDNFPHLISKNFTIFSIHSTPHTTILLHTSAHRWCNHAQIHRNRAVSTVRHGAEQQERRPEQSWVCKIPLMFFLIPPEHIISHLYNNPSNCKTSCSFLMCYYVALLLQCKRKHRYTARQRVPCARHEGVLGNGGTTPLILHLGIRRRWTPNFIPSCICLTAGWVGPRAGLDA